jgi:hypothetical protein
MIRRSWADGKKLDKKDGGYQWLYYTKRWKQKRKRQLTQHPLCYACQEDGHIKAATIVHHVHDHRGDQTIFFTSPLLSLCKACHDRIQLGSQVLSHQRGCDINGRAYKTKPIFIDKNKYMAGGSKIL